MYHIFIPASIQAMVRSYKLYVERFDWVKAEADEKMRHQAGIQLTVEETHAEHIAGLQRFGLSVIEMCGTTAVVVGISAVYLFRLQQVLPNYHWDVQQFCQNKMKILLA